MSRACSLLLAVTCLLMATVSRGLAASRHVVLVVWDGMRPDFVSPQYTPNLHRLTQRGTFFRRHHCAYISSTEVNGTALATGAYPAHSGILANVEHRANLGWLGTFGTEQLDPIRRGDLWSGGRYIAVPTLPEILQAGGIPTLVAGSKGVALLQDRAPRGTNAAQQESITLFRGVTLPRAALDRLKAVPEIGAPPLPEPDPVSNKERLLSWVRTARDKTLTHLGGKPVIPQASRRWDAWTTRALLRGLWRETLPRYSVLWLSEPDASQHETSPGSPNALAALADADHHLGLVVRSLEERGILDQTDILVVSDHGFSSIDHAPDLNKALRNSGFVAGSSFSNPEPGDVLTVTLGGSALFYVFDHHRPTLERLVEYLQGSDFAGVIFCAVPLPGTFPLSLAKLDAGPSAPDIVVAMRWRDSRNAWGTPGLISAPGGTVGRGAHGSLSPFDMNNTLIAAGPSFRAGHVSEIPSGNIDLVPTVLALLGLPRPATVDGRVLTEAFASSPAKEESIRAESETFEASRELGYRRWRQNLMVSRVGGVTYLERGNGETTLK